MIRPARRPRWCRTTPRTPAPLRCVTRSIRGTVGDVRSLPAEGEPSLEGGQRAEARLLRVGPDGDLLAGAALVGLGAAHEHAEPPSGNGRDVAEAEPGGLAAAEGGTKADQQQRPVAGAERGGGEGRVASVSRSTSGPAAAAFCRGRVPLSRAMPSRTMTRRGWRRSRATPARRWAAWMVARWTRSGRRTWRASRVAGQRLAPEGGAPGLVGAPGRAVGAAGALAAGASGVDRGARRERLQLGGLLRVARHPEVAEQARVQHQGFGLSGRRGRWGGRPGRGRGRVVVHAPLWPAPFRPEGDRNRTLPAPQAR